MDIQFSLHKKTTTKMEVADIAIAPLKEFVRDSVRLVKKCTKPDRREFTLIASKTAFGASSRSSSSSLSFFSHIDSIWEIKYRDIV
jgi:protein transport protein SEC61 subunit gamma-like protein